MKITDTQKGYVTSLGIHVLLVVVFLLITVDMTPMLSEFADLAFTMEQVKIPEPKRVTRPKPRIQTVRQSPKEQVKPQQIVELPKRRMLDLDDQEIPLEQQTPILADVPAPSNEDMEITSVTPAVEEPRHTQRYFEGAREDIRAQTLELGDKMEETVPSTEVGGGLKASQSYHIEWSGLARERIRGELPHYPPGVNKEVIIKVKFYVNPDGSVADVVLMQKGETRLESVTLDALRKWQFSPLDSNAPQILQEGTITFIYKLE